MGTQARSRRRNSASIWLGAGFALAAALAPGRARAATTSPEQGYDLGEFQSPRSLAFGGAQTALGTSTTALYQNPANLALARVYHFEAFALVAPEGDRQSYGGGVVDSNTSALAGGFAGSYNLQDPTAGGLNRTWTDFRLVLGYALGDRLAVGAAGRYLRMTQNDGSGPFGGDVVSDGTSSSQAILNLVTFDLGATLTPIDGLRIGVAGHNLTNPGTGLAPTTVQGGIGYGSDLFSVEADVLGDFTTYSTVQARAMAGAELFLGGHVPIRLGYRFDEGTQTHAISAGLGYIDKAWSFEVSGRHDIVGEHPDTMILAAVRFFYNPEGGSGTVDTSNSAF